MAERRRGWLFLLLLLSFLAAFPFRLERTYQWLRLKKVFFEGCPSSRIERQFFAGIPSDVWRFWPLFLGKRSELISTITEQEPLAVRLEPLWQGLRCCMIPLKIVDVFSWNGCPWYLAENGAVWSGDHPINKELYGVPNKPEITVDASMPSPVAGEAPVRQFAYDLATFTENMQKIRNARWPGVLAALRLFRQGGEDLASVYLRQKDGFVTIVVDRNRDIGAQVQAVIELFRSGVKIKSGGIIDASYKDKIVVQDS
ncbi:MAG: hypothetical protein CSA35_03475 [Dethiosulfovibrio peptidovorans]|nr:MAG: hypothetical protein CSA35_03475 [Dethiosulfovibrio peptidovorans]